MKTKEEIITELVGNVCWRAWRGVGTVLYFEFGEQLPDKKGGEPRKGTYTLGLSCPWQVFRGKTLLFNDTFDLKELDEKVLLFNNSRVTEINFEADTHEETICFENGLEIHIYHNGSDDQWHILTPELECVFFKDRVQVGPLE